MSSLPLSEVITILRREARVWLETDDGEREVPRALTQAADTLERLEATEAAVCRWEGGNDNWDTACGLCFVFNDGGPVENGFKFCYGCGQLIEVVPYVEEDEEDEEDEEGHRD